MCKGFKLLFFILGIIYPKIVLSLAPESQIIQEVQEWYLDCQPKNFLEIFKSYWKDLSFFELREWLGQHGCEGVENHILQECFEFMVQDTEESEVYLSEIFLVLEYFPMDAVNINTFKNGLTLLDLVAKGHSLEYLSELFEYGLDLDQHQEHYIEIFENSDENYQKWMIILSMKYNVSNHFIIKIEGKYKGKWLVCMEGVVEICQQAVSSSEKSHCNSLEEELQYIWVKKRVLELRDNIQKMERCQIQRSGLTEVLLHTAITSEDKELFNALLQSGSIDSILEQSDFIQDCWEVYYNSQEEFWTFYQLLLESERPLERLLRDSQFFLREKLKHPVLEVLLKKINTKIMEYSVRQSNDQLPIFDKMPLDDLLMCCRVIQWNIDSREEECHPSKESQLDQIQVRGRIQKIVVQKVLQDKQCYEDIKYRYTEDLTEILISSEKDEAIEMIESLLKEKIMLENCSSQSLNWLATNLDDLIQSDFSIKSKVKIVLFVLEEGEVFDGQTSLESLYIIHKSCYVVLQQPDIELDEREKLENFGRRILKKAQEVIEEFGENGGWDTEFQDQEDRMHFITQMEVTGESIEFLWTTINRVLRQKLASAEVMRRIGVMYDKIWAFTQGEEQYHELWLGSLYLWLTSRFLPTKKYGKEIRAAKAEIISSKYSYFFLPKMSQQKRFPFSKFSIITTIAYIILEARRHQDLREEELALIDSMFNVLKQEIFDNDNHGRNIVCMAVDYLNVSLLENLIKKGADVNTTSRQGSPLFVLCRTHRNEQTGKIILEIARRLVEEGARVDDNGFTMVNYTYVLNNIHDRNVHFYLVGGYSPLMVALLEHNIELAQYLMIRKANVDYQNREGRTALMLVTPFLMRGEECIEAYLQEGPFPGFYSLLAKDLKQHTSQIPWHQVKIEIGYIQRALVILGKSNLKIKDIHGRTFWHYLALADKRVKESALIVFKRDEVPEEYDSLGLSPQAYHRMFHAKESRVDLSEQSILCGLSMHQTYVVMRTLVQIASEKRYQEVIESIDYWSQRGKTKTHFDILKKEFEKSIKNPCPALQYPIWGKVENQEEIEALLRGDWGNIQVGGVSEQEKKDFSNAFKVIFRGDPNPIDWKGFYKILNTIQEVQDPVLRLSLLGTCCLKIRFLEQVCFFLWKESLRECLGLPWEEFKEKADRYGVLSQDLYLLSRIVPAGHPWEEEQGFRQMRIKGEEQDWFWIHDSLWEESSQDVSEEGIAFRKGDGKWNYQEIARRAIKFSTEYSLAFVCALLTPEESRLVLEYIIQLKLEEGADKLLEEDCGRGLPLLILFHQASPLWGRPLVERRNRQLQRLREKQVAMGEEDIPPKLEEWIESNSKESNAFGRSVMVIMGNQVYIIKLQTTKERMEDDMLGPAVLMSLSERERKKLGVKRAYYIKNIQGKESLCIRIQEHIQRQSHPDIEEMVFTGGGYILEVNYKEYFRYANHLESCEDMCHGIESAIRFYRESFLKGYIYHQLTVANHSATKRTIPLAPLVLYGRQNVVAGMFRDMESERVQGRSYPDLRGIFLHINVNIKNARDFDNIQLENAMQELVVFFPENDYLYIWKSLSMLESVQKQVKETAPLQGIGEVMWMTVLDILNYYAYHREAKVTAEELTDLLMKKVYNPLLERGSLSTGGNTVQSFLKRMIIPLIKHDMDKFLQDRSVIVKTELYINSRLFPLKTLSVAHLLVMIHFCLSNEEEWNREDKNWEEELGGSFYHRQELPCKRGLVSA